MKQLFKEPVSTFDYSDENEVKKAFNWKNTWAMVASDNFSKNKKIIEEQFTTHKKLLDKFIIENKE